jgi:hypothetical protein
VTSGAGTIELSVRTLAHLFNSFDPSPFYERDLDEDAEQFVISWARELPPHGDIKIVLRMPESEARLAQDQGVARAIHHHFEALAAMADRDLREALRLGRSYLWMALPVLAVCLSLSQVARSALPAEGLAGLAEESLIIFGWVACWKAIETLLYDWQPVKRCRDLFRRLAHSEVVVDGRAPSARGWSHD